MRTITAFWIVPFMVAVAGVSAAAEAVFPGKQADGYLLPNGWKLTPVGEHVHLSDLPLNIVPIDDRTVLVATSGYNRHELVAVDIADKKVLAREVQFNSWFGLAHHAGEVFWSAGGADYLHHFTVKEGKFSRQEPVKRAEKPKLLPGGKRVGFRSGLTWDPAAHRLYSLDIERSEVLVLDPQTGNMVASGLIGGRPYDIVVGPGGHRLYVSDWAGRAVLALSPVDLRVVAKIQVGEHPNQMVLHPKDKRLFVACANSNCVSVIDTARGVVTETIVTSLFPKAPEGSTPDALALAPDGKTLFVANADNNCIAVVDVATFGQSQVKGFIPTGWYPTAVAVTPDGKNLLVGVGKGNQFGPNPITDEAKRQAAKETDDWRVPFQYIGTILSGELSIVPVPDEEKLRAYTPMVYKNCPYSDALLSAADSSEKTVIPTKVGEPCPITHVIYIIKENRTYDQILSDLPRGNRDPSLLMFGEEVTPNQHKLANEFVLLDNLYCNGQVSRDGHPWSTMAYNTDYVARDWTLTYSNRAGIDDDDEGNLSRAPSGYLWDLCGRNGITYRNYGEYGRRVSQPDGTLRMDAAVPGLVGHMCPDYGLSKVAGRRARDTDNVAVFLREFKEYERTNSLPRFIVMSLGENHTDGTKPGSHTPKACVASNDLALGQLVDAVSKSSYWPRIAIFVIEDDAQNGPDHVDAHRTTGQVISPYTARGKLDSTQYQTVSMIRTMELILGLPPLSQYDAAARPMYGCFTATPDLRPYDHVPARIDLSATNRLTAYGADRSSKMDFSEYDRADDFELNEILWRSVKGADSPLPPAVRRALAFRPRLLAKEK